MSDADAESAEPGVDLDAYFERIGYGGPATATQATLAALQQSHAANIPFDAIDVFLHRAIDITPEAVDRKLIGQRRGGYCYEQNGLFRRVLRTLGFEVTSLIGRSLWRVEPDAPPRPRTHMALKVRIRGDDWLADVGNGVATPTTPLLWTYDISQRTPHDNYRLVRLGGDTLLEQETPEGWAPVYSLSPEPQADCDFDPANWWTCTHPSSWFRANLICALSPADARISLFNNRLTVRRPGAEPEQMILDEHGLERALSEVFGLPIDPAWRRHFRRAIEIGQETA